MEFERRATKICFQAWQNFLPAQSVKIRRPLPPLPRKRDKGTTKKFFYWLNLLNNKTTNLLTKKNAENDSVKMHFFVKKKMLECDLCVYLQTQ